MNALGVILFIVCAIALFVLPRSRAPLALLVGCCFITTGQGLSIGAFNLPVFRLLLIVGAIRILVRAERPRDFTTVDRLMIAWCAWTMFASLFQPYEPGSGPKFVAGGVFNIAGAYFVLRSLCRDLEDAAQLLRFVCIVLAPVALAMTYEQISNENIFSIFGRVPEVPLIRDGLIRAQGPFSHPILAGTIGATCFPFVVAIWSRYRKAALIGAVSCVVMVLTSASSGPIMSLFAGVFALGMWRYRRHCARLRYAAVAVYLLLLLVMNQAPYFLIARINLTGSSTGWHRAYLIQQTIAYFDEWAWVGTNRTRHWMPDQGAISATHTDITNYYIAFGVLGGLACMLLVIAMLWRSFKAVGEYVRHPSTSADSAFFIWCLGASLFSHAITSISVAYFGQSMVFFWLPVAVVASLHAALARTRVESALPSMAGTPAFATPVGTTRPADPFPYIRTPSSPTS